MSRWKFNSNDDWNDSNAPIAKNGLFAFGIVMAMVLFLCLAYGLLADAANYKPHNHGQPATMENVQLHKGE